MAETMAIAAAAVATPAEAAVAIASQ